jgi:hypothetical protein
MGDPIRGIGVKNRWRGRKSCEKSCMNNAKYLHATVTNLLGKS